MDKKIKCEQIASTEWRSNLMRATVRIDSVALVDGNHGIFSMVIQPRKNLSKVTEHGKTYEIRSTNYLV